MMGLSDALRKASVQVVTMIARGVISRINDGRKMQTLQVEVLKNEVLDGVEHFQPYGVSFHPPVGSEVLVLNVGGARSNAVAICANDREHRPTSVSAGEGGLYTGGQWAFFVDANAKAHVGAKTGAAPLARADRVEVELQQIQTYLAALSGVAGNPTNTYLAVGSVGCDNADGT